MGAMWLVGVGLVVSASVENTIGIQLMKRSFGESGVHRHNNDRLVWAGGLLLMVAGAASDFVAFGFAAQSLIAPLGATTLLCNALLAPLILGETVVKQDWISSAVIMIGCIIALAFGGGSCGIALHRSVPLDAVCSAPSRALQHNARMRQNARLDRHHSSALCAC